MRELRSAGAGRATQVEIGHPGTDQGDGKSARNRGWVGEDGSAG
eukprot:SAG11_NODE_34066_length_274_cov_0.582857_1_plen_43_part_01